MKLNLNWMEQIIVSKAITDEEYIAIISNHLKKEYFENEHLYAIFEVIRDFYDRRQTLPTQAEIISFLETSEQREALKSALVKTLDIGKGLNREELFANTERFIKERGIYHAVMSVAKDISRGDFDTSKILDQFESTCNISLDSNIGLDLFNEFNKVKADILQEQATISTGYKWLDEKLGGGLAENGRAMYIFAGETNIGKSIILTNVAVNVARQKKTVLVVSLEMSEQMYSRRIISTITSVAHPALASDIDIVEGRLDNFRESTGGRIIVKEFPPSTMTPAGISAYIKTLKNRGIHVDLIVLDYINLLTTTIGNNGYEKLKYIAESTRAITYTYSCPLITVTQLNRSGYSVAEPGLTAMSESYAVGATADFVASLWKGEGDDELGVMRTSILKNRFGRNFGSQAFKIDYATLTISENELINNMAAEDLDGSRMLMMLNN